MVLVTGATGILGRVIALSLVKKGRKVLAVKRPTSNLAEVKNSFQYYTEEHEKWFDKIDWVDVDFKDIEQIQEVLLGVEEVYHCAAKVSFYEKDKCEMFETNINGTQNWLYASANYSVKKFCFLSSIAVLDGINENGELDENSDYNPKFNHSNYAISKYLSEMEVWRASAEGLSTVIINPGVIIGSGNWEQSSGELIKTFKNNNYVTSGKSAYVDVRDVASIAIKLMDENIFGERFILISENKSYEEVGNYIRKKLNLSPLKLISDGLLNRLSFLSIFRFLFPKLSLLGKSSIKMLTSKTHVSNKKIKEKFNIDFIPINDSLDFHIKNYLNEKKLP